MYSYEHEHISLSWKVCEKLNSYETYSARHKHYKKNNYYSSTNFNVLELVRKEALRRGMSLRTIKSYQHCLDKFFRFYQYKDHRRISKLDVENYLNMLVDKRKANSTINLYLMSLRFFYEQCLRKRLTVNIKTSKIPSRLPEYLTQEETKKLFEVIDNDKHKLIVKLLYGTGLRVSELVHLKVKDFEFGQDYGWVRLGKGAKDRPFVIAKSLKKDLCDWIMKNGLEPHNYLFLGRCGRNVHYTQQSVRLIIKKARVKAKNTTMKYVHMAAPNIINAQSPLDQL